MSEFSSFVSVMIRTPGREIRTPSQIIGVMPPTQSEVNSKPHLHVLLCVSKAKKQQLGGDVTL